MSIFYLTSQFWRQLRLLTTWLIPETLDWRMVTASPIEGFLEALAAAVALNARLVS